MSLTVTTTFLLAMLGLTIFTLQRILKIHCLCAHWEGIFSNFNAFIFFSLKNCNKHCTNNMLKSQLEEIGLVSHTQDKDACEYQSYISLIFTTHPFVFLGEKTKVKCTCVLFINFNFNLEGNNF